MDGSFYFERNMRTFARNRRAVVAEAVAHLRAADPRLDWLIAQVGPFTLKLERDRFAILVRSIISQQISTKAARAIRQKLEATVGELSPVALTKAPETSLRSAGLSGQKVRYLRDLAEHVSDGRLDLERIHRHDDEAAIAALTAVHGIGRWTAQMFLMFSLGRLDIFPHDDLGIRASLRELYRLDNLPNRATAQELATPWRPYATIASWYLWRLTDLKTDPTQDASQYPV